MGGVGSGSGGASGGGGSGGAGGGAGGGNSSKLSSRMTSNPSNRRIVRAPSSAGALRTGTHSTYIFSAVMNFFITFVHFVYFL